MAGVGTSILGDLGPYPPPTRSTPTTPSTAKSPIGHLEFGEVEGFRTHALGFANTTARFPFAIELSLSTWPENSGGIPVLIPQSRGASAGFITWRAG